MGATSAKPNRLAAASNWPGKLYLQVAVSTTGAGGERTVLVLFRGAVLGHIGFGAPMTSISFAKVGLAASVIALMALSAQAARAASPTSSCPGEPQSVRLRT
jgi:hypothetical protein